MTFEGVLSLLWVLVGGNHKVLYFSFLALKITPDRLAGFELVNSQILTVTRETGTGVFSTLSRAWNVSG